MKQLMSISFAAATMLLALPATAQDRAEREQARADQAFAELVEGRVVSGEARRCISAFNSNRLRVVENVGIAYEHGGTLWVARARNPQYLDYWDVPVIERFSSQLCTYDVKRTIDRGTGMFSGVLFLDEFVPYREVEDAEG